MDDRTAGSRRVTTAVSQGFTAGSGRRDRKIFTTKLKGSITGNLRFNLQGDVTGPVAIYHIKGGKSTDSQ